MAPSPARRVLVLFAHPAFQGSRVQRRLLEAARATPGLTVHDLYEAYPDYEVDVAREQALLLEHDTFVLQHPFYWYGVPPLMKQWLDLVLEHGWAYGRAGTALVGRQAFSALSTGGGAGSYRPEGSNRYTIEQFLAPLEQTFRLCGVEWLRPFVVHGTHALDDDDIAAAAARYGRVLAACRDGKSP